MFTSLMQKLEIIPSKEALAKKRAEYANPRQGKEDTEKDNEHGSPIQHVLELAGHQIRQ